jgi:hypothetical protein
LSDEYQIRKRRKKHINEINKQKGDKKATKIPFLPRLSPLILHQHAEQST